MTDDDPRIFAERSSELDPGGWTLRVNDYRERAQNQVTRNRFGGDATTLANDVFALCAEIDTLREIIASERREVTRLRGGAEAYSDAVAALQKVTGRPLSTTIGFLIRDGCLVPTVPTS